MDQFALLAAKEPALIEAVEATALALGTNLEVAHETDELAQLWRDAGVRLVAPEMAGRVHWLPPVPNTHAVGQNPHALAEASAELRCPVLLLPEANARLAELFSDMTATARSGETIAVVGASGGLGVSTMALGLALTASADTQRAAVVELAPHGGGIDLLLGAETETGARWPELAGARGQLGNVGDMLIHSHGITVLSASRERPGQPDGNAARSVLGALARTQDIVVVDAGSSSDLSIETTVLVVAGDVRGVAAARAFCAECKLVPSGLVVRSGPGRRLAPGIVAEALGAPLLATVHEDAALPKLAELGQSPCSAPARRFRKDMATLWKAIRDA